MPPPWMLARLGSSVVPTKLSADGIDCGRYLVRTDTALAALYREVLEREAAAK